MAAAPVAIGMMVASQVFQGFTEKQGLDAAASADQENARRSELAGALDSEAIARQGRAVQGEAISALAANGVSIGTGSALDLLHQNQIEIEYDILNRRYSAGSEAASLRASAAQKRKAGKYALFGGVLRAGASALSGIQGMNDAKDLQAARMGGQQMPIPSGYATNTKPAAKTSKWDFMSTPSPVKY